jgi:DNA-binding SARP family transcriptional activator
LGTDDDIAGVPFHCDAATVLGALGELETAERHLAAATQRSAGQPDRVELARFILEARRGVRGDVDRQLERTPPVEWWRVMLVAALASAREGAFGDAQRQLMLAERELITLGFSDFKSLGERRAYEELRAILRNAPEAALAGTTSVRVATGPSPIGAGTAFDTRIRVIGSAMSIESRTGSFELPPGNPQRLVGVIVANGGSASFDQISEAIWPGDDVEASRVRLRNVLLRLRRAAGEIVVRAGAGLRLAPEVACDLFEFERLASDALSSARADPDLAGHLAEQAVSLVAGAVLGDFEYEEWAVGARRSVDQRLIGLLDLLSVRAEDAGDLPLAQSYAERALRLDRYTDSRYVRLAELLTLQGRSAAAVAVLEDATEVSRDLGGAVPAAVKRRRDDLMRRASNG